MNSESNREDTAEVMRVANEIRRYLVNHPKGVDSIHGITRWWLPRQRLEESASLVKRALDYLVAESQIKRKPNPSGGYLYGRSGPSHDDKT